MPPRIKSAASVGWMNLAPSLPTATGAKVRLNWLSNSRLPLSKPGIALSPSPRNLPRSFLRGDDVHPETLDIVSLQATVFQLVKATRLFADNFTVSEIKAVKRIEKAWVDSKLETISSLPSLVTEIESAGDLRAHKRIWDRPDGSSGGGSSSGFLGSSTFGGSSGGGKGGGGSFSPGFTHPST